MTTAGFKTDIDIRHIRGKNFLLLADLVFYSAEQERYYTAPAGITTDFASIPWWAQSFVQVLGNNIRSAVLHDFHCTAEGKEANQVSQKLTDDIFREGLAVDEVRRSKARVMFTGVTGFQRIKYFFKRGESYDGK